MTKSKPVLHLAVSSWGSVIVLCWLLILKVVAFDWMSGGMLFFFFLVAFISSVMASD